MKLLLVLVSAGLVIGGVAHAQKKRTPLRATASPMSEAQCLAWLHGDAGSLDARSERLRNVYEHQRKLTPECQEAASQEIRDAIGRLVAAGRITTSEGSYTTVAQYRWFQATKGAYKRASNAHGGPNDDYQIGMYVFHQPLFDIAMRSWHTNVFMEKGSDIVNAPDVTFDKSVVGYRTYVVTDQDLDGRDCKTLRAAIESERKARGNRPLEGLTITSGAITLSSGSDYVPPPRPEPSTVVEFIDAHTVRISRKTQSCVDGYSAGFWPLEWDISTCNCIH